ncbi:Bromodomain-containing protein [Backusella circina FSU 941]|nr:Bromodomain-containing protein [Backusella circina FSU 941]
MTENNPPWPQLSYTLATSLYQQGQHKTFLTQSECDLFEKALASYSDWIHFLDNNTDLVCFRTRAMLAEQLLLPTSADEIPVLDVYHSLEFDMPVMLEQRRLDYEEQQKNEEVIEERKVIPILNDSDHFDLKYLLQGISENRSKTSLSDRELRNLLLDVKPHKSKWANDDRIGQEDLYEACEKVLIDLKNHNEHAAPFLNKVSKREAPDYHEVITEPMDLGTVSKKLKNFQYKTKKEFSRDLYLIYENCLLYNTHPSSEYRKHATAMKRKTDRLLLKVPDIEIKDQKMDDSVIMDEEESEEEEEEEHDDGRERTGIKGRYSGKNPHHHHEKEEHDEVEAQEEIEFDLRAQTWLDLTKKTRARLTTDIEKQYQFDFGNRHILTRSSLDMHRFSLFEKYHDKPKILKKLMRYSSSTLSKMIQYNITDFDQDEDEEDNGSFFFEKKKKMNEEESMEERLDLFLPEYVLTCGLPRIEGVKEEEDDDDELERSMESLDIYSSTKCPRNGLNMPMDQNIQTLNQIRSIYQKCDMIRKDTPINPEFTRTIHSDTSLPIPTCTSNKPITIDKESSEQMIQRSLVQLLSHAGFEGANSSALNVLTDMMTEYLGNLGKTLRYYFDDYDKEMDGEEIMLHSLYENGINGFSELEDYIMDDVVKYGTRLNDVKRKLEYTFKDLVSNSTDEVTTHNETMFDDEQVLISGVFGDELGEDFFGFKELGIAQEYNMNTLNVPSKLWFGKEIFKKDEQRATTKAPITPAIHKNNHSRHLHRSITTMVQETTRRPSRSIRR